MLILTLLSLFTLLAHGHATCGTTTNHSAPLRTLPKRSTVPRPPIVIDMYLHMIHAGGTPDLGFLPTSQLLSQIDQLNHDFAQAQIRFNPVSVLAYHKPEWWNVTVESQAPGQRMSPLADEIARTIGRRPNYATLNIFVTSLVGLLGQGTYPVLPDDLTMDLFETDAVFVDSSTLPGGTDPNSNMGRTAVHEVGHWLNLRHVFEGGTCEGEGDEVADTPAQRERSSGCTYKAGTCGNVGQVSYQASHNFLDYLNDACTDSFTPGQIERMHDSWDQFRNRELTIVE